MSNEKTWGGKRPRSGRRPLKDPRVPITISLEGWTHRCLLQKIKAGEEVNLSEAIRERVKAALLSEGETPENYPKK